MSGGNLAATLVSAVAMIIFSRILGPADFGLFSVLFSLLLILSKVGDLGINLAVQREIARQPDDSAAIVKVASSGTGLKLVIGGILAAVGLLAGRWIGSVWLNLGEASPLAVWVFVLAGVVVLYEYATTLLQGLQLFGWSVAATFSQSLGKLGFALAYLNTKLSLAAVTLVYLILPLLGVILSLFKLPSGYFRPRLTQAGLHPILAVAKWTSIAILSATLADNLDVILVQKYLTSFDTGLWAAAVRISSLISLVAWSLGIVLNVRVAAYRNKRHLDVYLRKASLLSAVSLISLSGLTVFSSLAITYTVGSDFLAAVTPLNLLLISTAVLTATSPFVALFYLFDKPIYFAVSGLIGTAVLLLGDVILIPQSGIIGAGYARILSRVAVLVYTLFLARRAYREHYA